MNLLSLDGVARATNATGDFDSAPMVAHCLESVRALRLARQIRRMPCDGGAWTAQRHHTDSAEATHRQHTAGSEAACGRRIGSGDAAHSWRTDSGEATHR